jgi:hypothetical protein
LSKSDKITPKELALRKDKEETLRTSAKKAELTALNFEQKATPAIEQQRALAAKANEKPSFGTRPSITIETPKVVETKSPKVQEVEKKVEKTQRESTETVQVDNKSLEASIKQLTSVITDFSKKGSPDSSSTTKIDQNVSISIDVSGDSLTTEQIGKLKSELMAELEVKLRDIRSGKNSPPKKP